MIKTAESPLLILDFDIENRPLAYLGPDFTTAEITAIAASYVGNQYVHCWVLDPMVEGSYRTMLEEFVKLYNSADIVTGHYIRGHDLPVINGALMELGLPTLGRKETSDTKIDLTERKYISASQENLAAMLGVRANKYHMTNAMWREANRLTNKGVEFTRKRVIDDVRQHKELRAKLIELGYLGPTVTWG